MVVTLSASHSSGRKAAVRYKTQHFRGYHCWTEGMAGPVRLRFNIFTAPAPSLAGFLVLSV